MAAELTFGLDFTTVVKAGPGCRNMVPKTFAGMGCRRIALVTDKGLIAAGVIDKMTQAFEGTDVEIVGTFDNVRQDNDTRDINECAQWYKSIEADGLLGVGGGSVLDAAKAVKVMLGMGLDDIMQLFEGRSIIAHTRPKATALGIPHISLPTTAGTGAEVSQGSAILHGESRKKLILFHQYQNSDFAFLDPELTVSLPRHLTAEPAFDSLVHCFESFFTPLHNSFADALSLRAARLIFDNLPAAIENGNDLAARGELQVASCMSVVASVSGRGAAPIHNFADAVGPAHGISHGLANAVYAPIVLRNFPAHYLPRIRQFAQGLGMPIGTKTDEELLADVIAEVEALQEKAGIQTQFTLDIDQAQFDHLIAEVKQDPAGMQYPLPDELIITCLKESLTGA